jgi:5-methylcytosine-specific restriction protein A
MPWRPQKVGSPQRSSATPRHQDRGTTAERGYGGRWQRYRLQFLRTRPLCELCDARGETVAACVVDHILPHKGNQDLFWDPRNHQPLCKRCHDTKTATEDGGFGNVQCNAINGT